eukprot:scaffold13662_cov49-Phaeocystis_antarctica.AAC.3
MLRRLHNVGAAPRKASHEQQTTKPSSTTHPSENQRRSVPRNRAGRRRLRAQSGPEFLSRTMSPAPWPRPRIMPCSRTQRLRGTGPHRAHALRSPTLGD